MAANFGEEGNMADEGFALYNWQRTEIERNRFPALQRYYDLGGYHTGWDWDGTGMRFNPLGNPLDNRLAYVTRNFAYPIGYSVLDIKQSDVLFRDPRQWDPIVEVYHFQNAGVGSEEVWLDCYYPFCTDGSQYRSKPPDFGCQHKLYLFQLHTYLNDYTTIGNYVRILEFTEYQYVKIKIQDVPGTHWALPEPAEFPNGTGIEGNY